jgi:dihydrofolate reductase
MRKLVLTEFMTLDGIVEDPHKWSFPYWNDDVSEFKTRELLASDAMLLGRVTYEGFAAAWPQRDNSDDFTRRMNTYPKHVASRTLTGDLEWNNSHVIEGDVAKGVAELKKQDGKDIVIHGSPTLARSLMKDGLIDEYHLLVYPVVLGDGKRLFTEPLSQDSLKLSESRQLGDTVVALTYVLRSRMNG